MHYSKTSWISRALFAVILACVLFPFQDASAQRIALKTNTLDYLTLSPNLTMEARLSQKMSLQVGIAGNPFIKPFGDYKMANFRVEPELRYWFNRPMAKHFIALSTTAGKYSLQMKNRFISGDVIAAGISYGYALVLNRHWNVEFELGLGIASLKGYDYKGKDNKPDEKNMSKVMPVPIRAAVSFSYILK
ncbi:MAG: DUF3575 domain-containing protein [Muribaculum sp.]|nr:DUF3575 domain-containing protein [Muribaculum sp.]